MSTSWTHLYDHPGPFATVLADVSLDRGGVPAVETLAQGIGQDLDQLGADPDVVETVRATLADPVHEAAPRSRYVVATNDGVVVDEVIAAPTPSLVVEWEPLPDPGPLLTHRKDDPPFVLVRVDHEGGDVQTFRTVGDPVQEDSTRHPGPDIHKVRGGGLAHKRWQRSAENEWRDNAREVGEIAASRVAAGARLVVVAGSVESRPEVVGLLADGPADVVELERAGRARDGGDDALAHEVEEVHDAYRRDRREQLLAEVTERLGRDTRVATGVEAVIGALVQGQVDTLAIDLEAVGRRTVEPAAHAGLDLGQDVDGPLRADLALAAAAVRTDARVTPFTRDELDGHDCVALLRWDDQGT